MNLFDWPNSENYFNKINEKVKIVYIDSGCDLDHIEVKENILVNESESFVEGDKELHDYIGHGTQVISAITGKYNMTGLYRNSEIVIYKITNSKGETKFEWLYNALYKAIKENYKIINISYSGYTSNKYLKDKFEKLIFEAKRKNIHICCSANNFGEEENFSIPCDFDEVYKVASINAEDNISIFNTETNAKYFAPGGDDFFETENPQSFILLANSSLSTFNIGSEFGINERYTLNFGNSIASSYFACCISIIISLRQKKYNKWTSKEYIDNVYDKCDDLNAVKNTKEILENEYI